MSPSRRTLLRRAVVVLLAGAASVALAGPSARAQIAPSTVSSVVGDVPAEARFVTGPFDPARADWPVTAIEVVASLAEGTDLRVEILGGTAVVWSDRTPFRPPKVNLPVTGVWVRQVTGVRLATTAVLGEVVRPEVEPTNPWRADTTSVLAGLLVLATILLLLVLLRLLRSQPVLTRRLR